jgi:predicted nucleic acid-binding protein
MDEFDEYLNLDFDDFYKYALVERKEGKNVKN